MFAMGLWWQDSASVPVLAGGSPKYQGSLVGAIEKGCDHSDGSMGDKYPRLGEEKKW